MCVRALRGVWRKTGALKFYYTSYYTHGTEDSTTKGEEAPTLSGLGKDEKEEG